jgi:hypothetical protein
MKSNIASGMETMSDDTMSVAVFCRPQCSTEVFLRLRAGVGARRSISRATQAGVSRCRQGWEARLRRS